MHVDVTVRGPVPSELAHRARDEVAALDRFVQGPVMRARVVLTQEENPRLEQPARAEGEIVIARRTIRARVAAPGMSAAVDRLAERLRQQLRRHVERLVTRHHAAATVEPGEWRHAAWVPPRPPRSWRAPGERRVVRRKTYALEPIAAERAAAEMEALDHDFFLYRDADTGSDDVVYRRDDGSIAVLQPRDAAPAPAHEPSRYSAPLELATAIAEMDVLNHRFLYFTDAGTGRGCVLYLRYDGHYGLIEADGAAAA